MYWDGETDPSVEVRSATSFGTGFGMYHSWHSMPLTVQVKRSIATSLCLSAAKHE